MRCTGQDRNGSRTKAVAVNGVSEKWWSQTESNRRPQACKASALPTELWPRRNTHIIEARTDCKRRQPWLLIHASQARRRARRANEWWAWEELNFRPHAYQARALTN